MGVAITLNASKHADVEVTLGGGGRLHIRNANTDVRVRLDAQQADVLRENLQKFLGFEFDGPTNRLFVDGSTGGRFTPVCHLDFGEKDVRANGCQVPHVDMQIQGNRILLGKGEAKTFVQLRDEQVEQLQKWLDAL